MLPEVLSYDPKRPASFPDSGRTLTDDAVDVFLAILTNGKVTEDKVGPHVDLPVFLCWHFQEQALFDDRGNRMSPMLACVSDIG